MNGFTYSSSNTPTKKDTRSATGEGKGREEAGGKERDKHSQATVFGKHRNVNSLHGMHGKRSWGQGSRAPRLRPGASSYAMGSTSQDWQQLRQRGLQGKAAASCRHLKLAGSVLNSLENPLHMAHF